MKMNSFCSTPIRQKSAQHGPRSFAGLTPIKSPTSTTENYFHESNFDYFFNDVIAGDSPRMGENKRKCQLLNETDNGDKQKNTSPNSSRIKKRQRLNEVHTSVRGSVQNNTLIDKNTHGNITPGLDMFEEQLLHDPIHTPLDIQCKESFHLKDNIKEISRDVIEDSVLKNGCGTFGDDMVNLSLLERLENSLTEGTDMKDTNEDSNGLIVSTKETAVVDEILEKVDFEAGLQANTEENKMIVDQTGFSQILMESVSNWEKSSHGHNVECNSTHESKLADRIKKKLLGNVCNATIQSKTSGWSQIDVSSSLFEDSVIQNSQYQELGPFFGLPSKVQELYKEHKGIQELYYWQKECLTLKAVKDKKNLVYSLPTSGGKTLVAEILILRELLSYSRNVLFILPFVSIVQEKVHDLSVFGVELGFLVEEYAAGKGVIPLRKRRKRRSVVVATIEKASAVINSLIETKQLNEFGLIVVDELHLVSEESGRGAILESLLTQVLHIGERIQIIGMTATIGNINEIATFLKAEKYTGSFRPVELQEHVKCGNDIYTVKWGEEDILKPLRSIKSPTTGPDPDAICDLVLEKVPNNSVLVFCPTKKNCENVALLITEMMPKSLKSHKESAKSSFFKALETETNGQLCPIMRKTIPYGVVYHHSGLTPGERKLLEEAFRAGTLCVICCTSTLAAGVNLPAARVILRSPYIGKDFISLSKYKQMVGRAGRAGMGCKGESYLICQPMDCGKVGALLKSKMDESNSRMNADTLKSLILSSVGLGIATTRGQLRDLIGCTLLNVQAKKLGVDVKKMIDSCIGSLFKMGAIKVRELTDQEKNESEKNSILDITIKRTNKKNLKITNTSQLSVSRLGKAAMKGCIGLERAHELYGDLIKAQSSLVLLTELHLLYLVTPYESVEQIKPDNSVYFNVYMQLGVKELPAAKTIGVTEFVISRLATGMKPKNASESILNRFYVALILNEMLKQQNIWDVAKLFQLSAGMIQTLMTSTSTFANNVLRFCEELSELWPFKSLLIEFAPRLAHCCTVELIPLMELPAVKRGRAKQLFDAGFKTLKILANADVNELVRSVDHLPKRVAGQIVAAARLLLLEKAESLKEEAEEVLQGLTDQIVAE